MSVAGRLPLAYRLARIPVLNRILLKLTPRLVVEEGLIDVVGIGARRNADFAFQVLLQEFEIALYRRIDRGPLGLQIVDGIGLDAAGLRPVWGPGCRDAP